MTPFILPQSSANRRNPFTGPFPKHDMWQLIKFRAPKSSKKKWLRKLKSPRLMIKLRILCLSARLGVKCCILLLRRLKSDDMIPFILYWLLCLSLQKELCVSLAEPREPIHAYETGPFSREHQQKHLCKTVCWVLRPWPLFLFPMILAEDTTLPLVWLVIFLDKRRCLISDPQAKTTQAFWEQKKQQCWGILRGLIWHFRKLLQSQESTDTTETDDMVLALQRLFEEQFPKLPSSWRRCA